MSDDRVTVPDEIGGEDDPARTLRPLRLAEFVGQSHVREQLAVFLGAGRGVASHSTTCSCSVRPGSARRRSRTSSPPRRAVR